MESSWIVQNRSESMRNGCVRASTSAAALRCSRSTKERRLVPSEVELRMNPAGGVGDAMKAWFSEPVELEKRRKEMLCGCVWLQSSMARNRFQIQRGCTELRWSRLQLTTSNTVTLSHSHSLTLQLLQSTQRPMDERASKAEAAQVNRWEKSS